MPAFSPGIVISDSESTDGDDDDDSITSDPDLGQGSNDMEISDTGKQ